MSNRYGVFHVPRVRGGHRCVLGEVGRVNLSMSPQCSLSCRQLSGSHRSLTSSVLQAAGVSPEPQLTIITLQPLELSCRCRTSLASHDWLFDRWCHVTLARGTTPANSYIESFVHSVRCKCSVEKHTKDVSLFKWSAEIPPPAWTLSHYARHVVVNWRRVDVEHTQEICAAVWASVCTLTETGSPCRNSAKVS